MPREGNLFLAGQVDFEGMLPALDRWYGVEHDRLYETLPTRPDRPSILMGCPVWGETFIKRFTDLCLPTLFAPRNRQALSGACRITLFTDKAGKKALWGVVRQLTVNGYPARMVEIPEGIMARAHDPKWPLNKYWMLGTCQQQLLQEAGRHGLGFHMLMPDHVYSEAYFENLFRLAEKYKGIVQTTLSGDVGACSAEIAQFRSDDGALVIPDKELGGLAFRHLHAQTRQTLMNGSDLESDLPDSHCMVWVGRDFARLYCAHMNLAYLAPELVGTAPVRLFNALDTELPSYIRGEFCVPEIKDGMTFVELSDDTKTGDVRRVSLPELAFRCHMTTHFSQAFRPFFDVYSEVPIAEQSDYLSAGEIEKRHRRIVTGLDETREQCRIAFDRINQMEAAA